MSEIKAKVKNGHYGEIMRKYGIIFAMIALIVFLTIVEPRFMTPSNIFNVLTQSAIFGIMALGMTLVIISKGIDLSVGSLLAFSAVVAASLGQASNAMIKFYPNLGELNIIIPIVVAVGIGALLGAINGSLIAYTGIPAFIATLGMMTIARGFTLMYTGGKPVSGLTEQFLAIGSRLPAITIGGTTIFPSIPVPIIIYAVMIALTWVLLGYTRFGKSVYAIGGNIKAAEISGINVKKNTIKIYAYAGFLCGVAALVFTGRVGSVHPGAATGYELTAIAATTIGGTSHAGGIGTIWGAVVGALILGILRNGMTLLGVQAYWQQVVEGLIIIIAVIIDMRKNRKK